MLAMAFLLLEALELACRAVVVEVRRPRAAIAPPMVTAVARARVSLSRLFSLDGSEIFAFERMSWVIGWADEMRSRAFLIAMPELNISSVRALHRLTSASRL